MTAPKYRAPLPAADVATLLAKREARRVRTLTVLLSIGEATHRQLANALGLTTREDRNRLRSRLESWQKAGHVRSRVTRPDGRDVRRTLWSVVR